MRRAIIATAILLGTVTTDCVPLVVAAVVSNSKDKNREQRTLAAQESMVRSSARAAGYRMLDERRAEFVAAVFAPLEVEPTRCPDGHALSLGEIYCGVRRPSDHDGGLRQDVRETYRLEMVDALPLVGWATPGKYLWRSFVLDGLQIIHVYVWREKSRDYIAVVFAQAGE